MQIKKNRKYIEQKLKHFLQPEIRLDYTSYNMKCNT